MTVTVVIVGFRAYAELAPLLSILEHDPSAGVVGGLVRESDGSM
jgi:hypothetical protein